MTETEFNKVRFDELVKKRFFYTPAFSIYGGVSGLFDYGPPGCALQANILQLWRNHFILEEQMLELDTTILTPHDVLLTSGHVDRFTDLMVTDPLTGSFFRADHLLEKHLEDLLAKTKDATLKAEIESVLAQIDGYNQIELGNLMKKYNVRAPETGNALSDPVPFNLMFDSQIGPTGGVKGYMRPETAQGQFVNFKKLLDYNNNKMPFASAQIGRSFRNEISPRSGLLRVREFTMAEVEHYVHPERKNHSRFHEVADMKLRFLTAKVQSSGKSDIIEISIGEAVKKGIVNNETLGYFLARTWMFLLKIGIDENKLRFRQHMQNEMAHYASDCWDAEIKSSFGWIECVGCADRSCYDLTNHSKRTGEKLVARETLPAPKQVTKTILELNKKELGMKFKKNAKDITNYLENLTLEEINKIDSKTFNINLPDGSSYEINETFAVKKSVTETLHVEEYIPSVIEPSFGIGRILYSLLEHSFRIRDGDEQRAYLTFPPVIAPVKCLIVPLSSNEVFNPFITILRNILRKKEISYQCDDSSSTIGRRYSRNDELGIPCKFQNAKASSPVGITIDFQTVDDNTITLRERDSTKQVRIPISDIGEVIYNLSNGETIWSSIQQKYPEFSASQ